MQPEFPISTLLDDLGEDADLLTRSDRWLETERRATATKMTELARALQSILLAQRIKQRLQQNNMVAVQHLLRDGQGEVSNIMVRIMNLPDAVASIKDAPDTIGKINRIAQMKGWSDDGYDTDTAAKMRP